MQDKRINPWREMITQAFIVFRSSGILNILARWKEWSITIIRLAYFIPQDKMIYVLRKWRVARKPTESEQNTESCSEECVRGNTLALSDPRWHRLAWGSWGVTVHTRGLFFWGNWGVGGLSHRATVDLSDWSKGDLTARHTVFQALWNTITIKQPCGRVYRCELVYNPTAQKCHEQWQVQRCIQQHYFTAVVKHTVFWGNQKWSFYVSQRPVLHILTVPGIEYKIRWNNMLLIPRRGN